MIFSGSGQHGRDRQADRHPRAAHPRRARRPLPPDRRRSRPTSGPSSSSAPSSTTPTSCRGASRSPTWSPSSEDADGHIDQAQLEAELEKYADRPLKIGSFSAASNVTGIVSDTFGIATLLHAHGALSFWDFAACAPYVDIDMYPPDGVDAAAYKDAIFLSPHKFIGGPGHARRAGGAPRADDQPGAGGARWRHGHVRQPRRAPLLSTTRSTARRAAPPASSSRSAPGWCSSSSRPSARRPSRPTRRRCSSGPSSAWQAEPRIEILGNLDARRLSIVSFVVRAPSGDYLHHNYVVAVLNDLFGIQTRGGCSCAGPYGHRLLGIDLERPTEFERADRRRLRGHQARLGAGQLQLLRRRRGRRLHDRGRADGRPRRLAAARRLRLRPDDGAVAAPRRVRSSRPCACATCRTTRPAR